MAYTYICQYPDWESYPTTYVNEASPEPSTHGGKNSVPYRDQEDAKVFHNRNTEVQQPRVDVFETPAAFHVVVELPGLTPEDTLILKWMSIRDILVSCTIRRKVFVEHSETEVCAEALIDDDLETLNETIAIDLQKVGAQISKPDEVGPRKTDSADSTSVLSKPKSEHKTLPHLTIGERNIGLNARAFNFPVDVDRNHTRAWLNAGLLTLKVPKKPHEQGGHHPRST